MRILVLSDSHGRRVPLERAIEAQPQARAVFFLGDFVRDAEELPLLYPERTFYTARGNCDFASDLPETGCATVGGVKIFYTHGHTCGVKSGTGGLEQAARRAGATIALYGHTHVAEIHYRDGLYLVNPGSVSQPREGPASYAVIDLTPAAPVPVLVPC